MQSKKVSLFVQRVLAGILSRSRLPRYRQRLGGMIGFIFGLVVVCVLVLPGQERFHVKGAMNVGHEEVSCGSCHKFARGTVRQQIQANAQYVLGVRETPVDFGHQPVTNAICLECHDRPNDRHPVFRFFEPRFAAPREKIQPQFCLSCHLEHSGKRVTTFPITFCVHCHKDTSLRHDPTTISHEDLIAADQWESCLGCHDFHGNHVMQLNRVVEQVLPSEKIREYFEGGASPYSDTKYYKAKPEATNE